MQNANSLLDDSHTWQGKDTDIDSYTKMIEQLETIKGHKDSTEKIQACQNKIEEIKQKLEEKRIAEEKARIEQERKKEEERILAEQQKEKRRKKVKKITIMAISVLCAIIVLTRGIFLVRSNIKYNEANALLDEKRYIEAFIRFSEISGYKDSAEKTKVIMKDKNIDKMVSIAYEHTIGLKSDGTVVAIGDNKYGQCNVSDWNLFE